LNSLFFANRHPITCLYRPPKLENFEAFLNKARQRSGARLVPTNTAGVKTLYATLAQHDTVGILPDQDPGKGGGIQAPFFGINANTIKLIPRLISKTGARVVMVYARRLPRGRGYHIHYLRPDDDIYSADIASSCKAMNRAVESCIRDNMSQYQWAYKRFKTQADGQRSPYDT
jgi:KDO2-lipid IV(A) lauroyltransferase